MFELPMRSRSHYSNPFTDVKLKARFYHEGKSTTVQGFYDGDDVYKIRFMPESEGEYTYRVQSNDPDLNGISGTISVTPPSGENHGPVRVSGTEHFSYADGTPFFVMGTTAYVWHYRPAEIRQKDIAKLFKIRVQ